MGNYHVDRAVAIKCLLLRKVYVAIGYIATKNRIANILFYNAFFCDYFYNAFGLVPPDNIATPFIRNSIDINRAFEQIPLNQNINLFNLFTSKVKRSKFKLRLHTHF
jgi:hypothetical protein